MWQQWGGVDHPVPSLGRHTSDLISPGNEALSHLLVMGQKGFGSVMF